MTNKVRFANEAAAKLFRRSTEQLRRSHAEELIAPRFLNVEQEHFCGTMTSMLKMFVNTYLPMFSSFQKAQGCALCIYLMLAAVLTQGALTT